MDLHNLTKSFVKDLCENPHSVASEIVHAKSDSGQCVICSKNNSLSVINSHVHFLDRIKTEEMSLFIGTGTEKPETVSHTYNKLSWVEHPFNLNQYLGYENKDIPYADITYSLKDLFWVVNRGVYYAYDFIDSDQGKTDLAYNVSNVRKKIYMAQSCYTTPEAYILFTEGEKEAIACSAKGFSVKVNPNLADNIKPLLDKKAFPLGSFPEF